MEFKKNPMFGNRRLGKIEFTINQTLKTLRSRINHFFIDFASGLDSGVTELLTPLLEELRDFTIIGQIIEMIEKVIRVNMEEAITFIINTLKRETPLKIYDLMKIKRELLEKLKEEK